MKNSRRKIVVTAGLLLLGVVIYRGLAPIRELMSVQQYTAPRAFAPQSFRFDPSKRTVLIVADNEGTELIDLMAPYNLFSATDQANVYIVAQQQRPIVMDRGVLAMPHLTFHQVDSLGLRADVVAIPAVLSSDPSDSARQTLVDWIRHVVTDSTRVLSICDGARIAAATGLYDGKPITDNAMALDDRKQEFPRALWQEGVSVTRSGNLYSTAGTVNGIEGSLMVIEDLFGKATMKRVADGIRYPHQEIRIEHENRTPGVIPILHGLGKVLFGNDRRIALLLQDGIDELDLSMMLNVYVRSIPESINTVVANGSSVTTRHGLTLIETLNEREEQDIEELHVLAPGSITSGDRERFGPSEIIEYDPQDNRYLLDICLDRVAEIYGRSFADLTMLLMDYNRK